VARRLAAHEDPAELAAYQFVFVSPLIALGPEEVNGLRAPLLSTGNARAGGGALDLVRRIYADFTYDKSATTVDTAVDQVLADRKGVCQDFAHVAISCLRVLGLAARYVSGYLETSPPPGKPKLVGADASHAWISLFVPDAGWVDLDPTNNLMAGESHITLAWGRDYGDVTPVKGVVMGGGRHTLAVTVDVAAGSLGTAPRGRFDVSSGGDPRRNSGKYARLLLILFQNRPMPGFWLAFDWRCWYENTTNTDLDLPRRTPCEIYVYRYFYRC
jgi:transglutaminase-like putative cysteine protease